MAVPDRQFCDVIRNLNRDYRLDLPTPYQESLDQGTTDQDPNSELYSQLLQHHSNDRRGFFQAIHQFRVQASQRLTEWVDKPLADPDTLPSRVSPRAPLGARNPSERAALYNLLREILGERMTEKDMHTSRPSGKRTFDEHFDGTAKRTRSSGDVSEHLGAIDAVPVRTQCTLPQLRHRASSQSRPNPSASTSRTSFTSNAISLAQESKASTPPSSQDTSTNVGRNLSQEHLRSSQKYDLSPRGDQDWTESFSQLIDDLGPRFQGIWPVLPEEGLNEAPFPVVWEITRAALHCDVDLRCLKDFEYDHDRMVLWSKLRKHPLFENRSLPPPSPIDAWKASFSSECRAKDKAVIFKAELINEKFANPHGKAFRIKLYPVSTQLGHRLDRRFGSDRFIELDMPALRHITSSHQEEDRIMQWLQLEHAFLGRRWRAFWTKSEKGVTKTAKAQTNLFGKDKGTERKFLEKVYLFAVDGNNFHHVEDADQVQPALSSSAMFMRRRCSVRALLDWALNLENDENARQLTPKLFSRLALSLSRSIPAIVLEKYQIINEESDLLNPATAIDEAGETRMIMNDGAGVMSRSLGRAISERLGLDDVPSAFQARLGSAKGMWVIDVTDDGSEDRFWIKTYPSQRKWNCDFEDPHHRTFEVKNWPRDIKSAELNNQFIPVLENRAKDRKRMRYAIAQRLSFSIRKETDAEKDSLKEARKLRQIAQQSGPIFFKGGLPSGDKDRLRLLLDHGFSTDNKMVCDLLWNIREERVRVLKQKSKIPIPCSAYLYMIPDFWGILEPGEISITFSNQFRAEGSQSTEVPGFSDTLVEDCDVLVGRSPAHLPSDIQRVRAVSHTKLRKLKDVIVFSTKGSRPLADLLSGGDYDGDTAWVCWDDEVVSNFDNAPPDLAPPELDFVGENVLQKITVSFRDILGKHAENGNVTSAYDEFLGSSLSFNLQKSMLGICTKYKERLCYYKPRGVADPAALTLSFLLGHLVDQAKAGYTLTNESWKILTSRLKGPSYYEEPEYEKEKASDQWRKEEAKGKIPHILDYLKFSIARDIIDRDSEDFEKALDRENLSKNYDSDLTNLFNEVVDWEPKSGLEPQVLTDLKTDLRRHVKEQWDRSTAMDFDQKVQMAYTSFMEIAPRHKSSRSISCLNDAWLRRSSPTDRSKPQKPEEYDWSYPISRWSLLKASTLFQMYHRLSYTMCWHVAGRQLMHMKAMISPSRNPEAVPITMVSEMYAIMRPDKKAIKRLLAAEETAGENDSALALEEVADFDDEGTVIDDA